MTSLHPHAVLVEAGQRPDECVELDLGAGQQALLRWTGDGFEAVHQDRVRVSERHQLDVVCAAGLVADALAAGGIEAWRPVEYFAATCNPGDRPEVRS